MSAANPAEDAQPPGLAEPEDEANLDEVYRQHGNWLVGFLRRRFGRQDAEDLAQETYVRTAAAGVELRNPRAFLARVALNAARDQARRRSVRPGLVSDEKALGAAATEAHQVEALLMKEVILTLPPRLRQVFLLSRAGGLTYEEIAHRCGLSVKTVEGRMTKALAMCASRLRD